jgi:hypothetical protein
VTLPLIIPNTMLNSMHGLEMSSNKHMSFTKCDREKEFIGPYPKSDCVENVKEQAKSPGSRRPVTEDQF